MMSKKNFPESSQRRQVLAGLSALAAGMVMPRWAQAMPAGMDKGTHLILLGTKGGPRVGGDRSNPANVLIVDGTPYVIDCGRGVSRQLEAVGVQLISIRDIFITHMHSDHYLELGGLIHSAWDAGLKKPVTVHGPVELEKALPAFFETYMQPDIDIRMADVGRPDLRKMVHIKAFENEGVVFRNDQITVTTALTIHPPIKDSYALRFDTKDRSIVFSGDTAYSEAVIKLAKGADVLVHEALYLPGIDAMLKRVPNGANMREHMMDSHTTTEDVGRVAAAAGVKTVVLTHLVPGDGPTITDEMWAEGVRKHFKGQIIVGKDLMVI